MRFATGGEAPGLPGLIKALQETDSALAAPDLLARVLDQLPLGIALYDASPDFRLLYLNDASMSFAPPQTRRPVGRRFVEVFPDAVRNGMIELMTQVRDTGVAWRVRPLVTRSGRVWNVDLIPLGGVDGATRYLLMTGQDITDHAQAETRLELLLDSTHALLEAISPHDVAAELAVQARRLLPELDSAAMLVPHDRPDVLRMEAANGGWAEALVGRDFDIEHSLAGEAVRRGAVVEASIAGSGSRYRELLLASGVGLVRAVPLTAGRPLTDGRVGLGALAFYTPAQTPFTDGQRGLMDDLARRGGLALHRAELQAAADRMTRRLQLAVDTALDLASRLDPEQVGRRLLERALESLDADRGTIAVVDGDELVVEASHARDGGTLERGMRFPAAAHPVMRRVDRAQRPVKASRAADGLSHPALQGIEHLIVVPMTVGGTTIGVAGLARRQDAPFTDDDLATYSLLATVGALALRNARAFRDIEGASAAKTQFMNMAAHELRTPLSVLAGYISMLRDGSLGPPSPVWAETLGLLEGKADELNRLVDGLLMAARLEAGTTRAGGTPVDLRSEVEAAAERAHARARLRDARLSVRLPSAPVRVRAGADHLARILDNLINNALTYSAGAPWVRVTVASGRMARVTVEDRGIGIAEDMSERIFDKFVRIENEELGFQTGTGLGLYLSRELANLYGGTLRLAASAPGSGSKFVLSLPLDEPQRSKAASSQKSPDRS